MLKYTIKRLLLIIPTLIGVLFIVFAIMNFTPGNPARQILGISAKQESVDQLNHELGYDKPFFSRFVSYVSGLLHGDLGVSYKTRQDFSIEFFGRLPVTLKLGSLAFVFSSIIGISLGILSAVKQYSLADTFSTFIAIHVCIHSRVLYGDGADLRIWPAAWMVSYIWHCRCQWICSSSNYTYGRRKCPDYEADAYNDA